MFSNLFRKLVFYIANFLTTSHTSVTRYIYKHIASVKISKIAKSLHIWSEDNPEETFLLCRKVAHNYVELNRQLYEVWAINPRPFNFTRQHQSSKCYIDSRNYHFTLQKYKRFPSRIHFSALQPVSHNSILIGSICNWPSTPRRPIEGTTGSNFELYDAQI